MKEAMANLKVLSAKNIAGYALILLNLIACIYVVTAAALAWADVAANAFAFLFVFTAVADMAWGAFTKRRWGFWLIAGIAAAFLINYLGLYLVTLSVFENSFSVAGAFVLFLIPVASLVLIGADMMQIEQKPSKIEKLRKFLLFAVKPALCAALLAIAILGYDAVNNFGESVHAYTTTRAGILFLLAAIAIVFLLLRLCVREGEGSLKERLKSEFAFIMIAVILSGLAIGYFSTANAKVNQDAARAKAAYVQAFNDEIFERDDEGFAKMPFNLSQYFLGIPTTGYSIERNNVYTEEGISGSGNILKLSYDAYVPNADCSVNSVLISIHGRGGDKDTGNYAQKHKYFASRGYTVFDLQVGDFNEKGTGFPKDDEATYMNMSENLLLFFDHLKANNLFNANLDSVFITGGSMGGGITMIAGLSFANRIKAKGITVKGLIPYYPVYYTHREKEEDYLQFVNETSAPCLLILGENDGTVDMNVIAYADKAYKEKGKGQFAGVWISSAGHGCDGMFVGRANQIINYFVERFMAQFR